MRKTICNREFTLADYENALKRSSNSAAGEDRTYYSMITYFPPETSSFLLALFYRIFIGGVAIFPTFMEDSHRVESLECPVATCQLGTKNLPV